MKQNTALHVHCGGDQRFLVGVKDEKNSYQIFFNIYLGIYEYIIGCRKNIHPYSVIVKHLYNGFFSNLLDQCFQ